MTGFDTHARLYDEMGWAPLPLPHGAKWPPPEGWTGYDAPMPSYADIEDWVTSHAGGNIALRLPPTIIGIDYDAYKADGVNTMNELTARLGPLPATWRSSSKDDGASGIYLYRVPGGSVEFGDVGKGIETIRHEHRYMVVFPSVHPEGPAYRWWAADGSLSRPPRPEEVPELPAAWVQHLLDAKKAKERPKKVDVPHEAYDALAPDEKTRIDAFVTTSIEGIQRDLAESAGWAVGQTDSRGRGWEKLQADKAIRLAAIVKADWNPITEEQAFSAFVAAAPTGGGWTSRDVASKWQSQFARAEAAPFPVAPPRVDLFAGAGGLPGAPAAPGVSGGVMSSPPAGAADADEDLLLYNGDIGRAELVLQKAGGALRFARDAGTWAEYHDGLWFTHGDAGARAAQRVISAEGARLIAAWTKEMFDHGRDTDDGKALAKRIATARVELFSSASYTRCSLTMSRAGVHDVRMADFDQRRDLLVAANGTIDLRTGTLLEHSAEILATKGSPVAYDPTAAAPRFLAWLAEALPDIPVEYLQMVMGVSLTGERLKSFFVHEGERNAGKTMWLDILTGIIGEQLSTTINENLVTGRAGVYGDSYSRAALRGARAALLDETQADGRAYTTSLKALIGGSRMNAREPGFSEFSFEPFFKLHIATNEFPSSKIDPAFADRLHLIPWVHPATPERRDAVTRELGMPLDRYILEHELPGVLAWAVRGAVAWYEQGMPRAIPKPLAVELAVAGHQAASDFVAQWLEENTIPSDTGYFLTSQAFTHYVDWLGNQGIRDHGKKLTFAKRLGDLAGELGLERGLFSSTRVAGYRGRVIVAQPLVPLVAPVVAPPA